MLLDFDTLPEKPQDADAVVRFRLKKSLPFDVDQSAVSFDRQGTANPVRVVAAVTPRTVLEEYESLVRDAGYNPGAVLPSMLAALGLVDASRPTMVIKVERGTTTFAIVDQNQLLLYRALENGGVDRDRRVAGRRCEYLAGVLRRPLRCGRRSRAGDGRGVGAGAAGGSERQRAIFAWKSWCRARMAGAAAGNVPRSALAGVAGALVS